VVEGAPILDGQPYKYRALCMNLEALRGLASSVDRAYQRSGHEEFSRMTAREKRRR
jgi:hypothetical protein